MEMRTFGMIVACVLAAACAAPQGAQVSTEAPAMSKQWEAAFNAGDMEALAGLYAEDCRLLPPGEPIMEGRDAVRTVFGAMADQGLGGTLTSVEAMQAGDLAYNLGTYAVSTDDGTIVGTGKFVELWQKIDGEWKMTNDIWNQDPGPELTTVTVTHEVEDQEAWVAAWTGPDSREELFRQHGVASARIFTSPDDPERVGLILQVADMDALMSFMQSPEALQAASDDGVVWDTVQFMTEAG